MVESPPLQSLQDPIAPAAALDIPGAADQFVRSRRTVLLEKLAKFEQTAPRVLYTWIDQKKLTSMIRQFQGKKRGFYTGVCLSRTPLSTFMYGPILVRVKLRPPPYAARDAGDDRYFSLPNSQTVLTTRLRQVDLVPLKLREYVLQGFTPELIESFSFSMPQNMAEIDQERALIGRHRPSYLDFAFRETRTGRPVLFHPSAASIDGHPWNREVFESRIAETKAQIEGECGAVIYARGVDRRKSPHFADGDLKSQLLTEA